MKLKELFEGVDWEKEILNNKSLFVTSYSVKGSRVNGIYLVNAKNKAEANRIVKNFNPSEYTGIKSTVAGVWIQDYGDYELAIPSNKKLPSSGNAEHIESGT
jgi:hypothetical protein